MLETVGGYVTQMISWVGTALTDTNIQPFVLFTAAAGIVGTIIGLAKYIVHIRH